jgi:hypothetical protein
MAPARKRLPYSVAREVRRAKLSSAATRGQGGPISKCSPTWPASSPRRRRLSANPERELVPHSARALRGRPLTTARAGARLEGAARCHSGSVDRPRALCAGEHLAPLDVSPRSAAVSAPIAAGDDRDEQPGRLSATT